MIAIIRQFSAHRHPTSALRPLVLTQSHEGTEILYQFFPSNSS